MEIQRYADVSTTEHRHQNSSIRQAGWRWGWKELPSHPQEVLNENKTLKKRKVEHNEVPWKNKTNPSLPPKSLLSKTSQMGQ